MPYQKRCALAQRFRGFDAQQHIIVVADRVRDHRQRESGHACYLGHRLGGLHKAIGDDRGRHDPGFLGRNGIVHTARRATASITNGGDHRLARLHGGQDFRGCRAAGIGLFEAQHARHSVP